MAVRFGDNTILCVHTITGLGLSVAAVEERAKATSRVSGTSRDLRIVQS
jgi:hypothetical protein